LSLLLSLELDRRSYRFHDTVRHFLQTQAGNDALIALHKALLQAMAAADSDADESVRRYYYLHRAVHLAAAGWDALLEDPAWLQTKLDALGSLKSLSPITSNSAKASFKTLLAGRLG
jgi:hypothetical protein